MTHFSRPVAQFFANNEALRSRIIARRGNRDQISGDQRRRRADGDLETNHARHLVGEYRGRTLGFRRPASRRHRVGVACRVRSAIVASARQPIIIHLAAGGAARATASPPSPAQRQTSTAPCGWRAKTEMIAGESESHRRLKIAGEMLEIGDPGGAGNACVARADPAIGLRRRRVSRGARESRQRRRPARVTILAVSAKP